MTTDPEAIKRILSTDFQGYEKGPELRAQMQTLLGTGVFNSDGDMWKCVLSLFYYKRSAGVWQARMLTPLLFRA